MITGPVTNSVYFPPICHLSGHLIGNFKLENKVVTTLVELFGCSNELHNVGLISFALLRLSLYCRKIKYSVLKVLTVRPRLYRLLELLVTR